MILIASKRKSLGRAGSDQPLLNGHPRGNDSGRLNGTSYLIEVKTVGKILYLAA